MMRQCRELVALQIICHVLMALIEMVTQICCSFIWLASHDKNVSFRRQFDYYQIQEKTHKLGSDAKEERIQQKPLQ